MRPLHSSTLLLAALSAGTAQAEILFSCTTTQGKPLQIEIRGNDVHYRYGVANAPGLAFSQARSDIEHGACSSKGRRQDWLAMTTTNNDIYTITVESGAHPQATIEVHFYTDRPSNEAFLTCKADSIENRLSQLGSISSPCEE